MSSRDKLSEIREIYELPQILAQFTLTNMCKLADIHECDCSEPKEAHHACYCLTRRSHLPAKFIYTAVIFLLTDNVRACY